MQFHEMLERLNIVYHAFMCSWQNYHDHYHYTTYVFMDVNVTFYSIILQVRLRLGKLQSHNIKK